MCKLLNLLEQKLGTSELINKKLKLLKLHAKYL
jgi:hypothetical protein